MDTALGPASLLFSNFMIIIMLIAIRWLAATPSASLNLVAVGNLICGSLIFFPRLTGRATSPWDRKNIVSVISWALCYSVTYSLYSLYPQGLSLSDLIIAESLAPTAAVILSGDWRSEKSRFQKLFANLGTISLLLILAYLKRDTQADAQGNALLIFVTMVCFLGTNIAARNVAKLAPPLWSQARVSALNGVMLTLIIWGTQNVEGSENMSSELMTGAVFAIGILLTQGSFIFGLARTSPFLSALLISTSVPLSLLSEAISQERPLISTEGTLGVLYCFFIWLTQKWFAREDSIKDDQPPSPHATGGV